MLGWVEACGTEFNSDDFQFSYHASSEENDMIMYGLAGTPCLPCLYMIPPQDPCTLYSACLLSVFRIKAQGRLVPGIVAHDIPMLHRALPNRRKVGRYDFGGVSRGKELTRSRQVHSRNDESAAYMKIRAGKTASACQTNLSAILIYR